jgi:hypothetical protein
MVSRPAAVSPKPRLRSPYLGAVACNRIVDTAITRGVQRVGTHVLALDVAGFAKRHLRHSSIVTLLQFIPSQKLEEQCVLRRLIKRLRVDLLRMYL